MAVDYEPDGAVAGIDVFYCHPLAIVASSKEEWRENHLSKWRDFTRSEPRFHEVGGAHYTMLNTEHVFAFQKTLRGALEARGL
jgi:thioesterase domain-containing protein